MEEKNKSNIKPEKITKPIQLLAAWLVGLISIESIFLYIATTTNKMAWISGLLVVASTINVPMFLLSMFILHTKFRPEMQKIITIPNILKIKWVLQKVVRIQMQTSKFLIR